MTASIAGAAWQKRVGLDGLTAALGAVYDECRYVGGAVRDTLLGFGTGPGMDVSDIDIATRHTPDQVIERLTAAGIRVVPTGLAHGTITAILPSGPIEVTTLRRDVETDGRHALVAFTDDWRDDAARRDFTINALYASPIDGSIHDYFGGLDDLAARHIRFIGDPFTRIAEDHLRILRFFRFLARFGERADPDGLAACTARANDLMALSRERIAAELLKLLVARGAVEVVRLMLDQGIFRPVLPEIHADGVAIFARLATREALSSLAPDGVRRLTALLPPDRSIGDTVAARLKLSKAQRKRIAAAIGPVDAPPRTLAFRLGAEGAIDRMLTTCPVDQEALTAVHDLSEWPIPDLPITGGDLVARGVTRGPEVARLLHLIEDRWVDEGFPDTVRVEQIASAVVDQWLKSRIS